MTCLLRMKVLTRKKVKKENPQLLMTMILMTCLLRMKVLTRKKGKKRKSTTVDDDDSDDDAKGASYKAGGSGIHRPMAKAKRSKTDSVVGHEYQSKKAAGDMKKKGKPDPYAYVSLNIANLNKRKHKKVKGTF